MLYHLYELSQAALSPTRIAANSAQLFFSNPFNPLSYTSFGRKTVAASEVLERVTRRYKRPVFGIGTTLVDGQHVAISEETVWQKPFCNLVHFRKHGLSDQAVKKPNLLIVAPMSGHYATLLRGTVEAMLPHTDVYITDWVDARLVSTKQGAFDLDDYIDYVIEMFELFQGDVHVMAVCQPAIPVLSAIALMEKKGSPSVPHSAIIKGGPVDTRISPTAVNKLAVERGTNWFRNNVIVSVPWPNEGFGRYVYPGFLQLTGFMMMNLERHIDAHHKLFDHLVKGDGDSVEKHKEFYDEYLAVMDLPSEYYLQTIDQIFVKHQLAKGEMKHRGELIDLGSIKNVAMMTIEGEKDDITGRGQCEAALHLCTSLADDKKAHHEQAAVGHYGIFNGSRYRRELVPKIVDFIMKHHHKSPKKKLAAAELA